MEDIEVSENLKNLANDILKWKELYRNIYYFKIGKNEYIFRLLNKEEYLALYFIQFHISDGAEDILLEKCVLFPKIDLRNIDNLLAGEVVTLISKILQYSGFSSIENIKDDLVKEREKIQLLDNQIVLMVCKAFPHITPSDIGKFDYPTIIHHVALAEELLGSKLEITNLNSPENTIDFEKENQSQGFIGSVPNSRPLNQNTKRR